MIKIQEATVEMEGGHVYLTLHHEKGCSVYFLFNGSWYPKDGPSTSSMSDLLGDLVS